MRKFIILIFWVISVLALLNSGKILDIKDQLGSATFFILIYLSIVLIFKITTKIHILFSLVFLFLIPPLILAGYDKSMETLSTLIYYFLILIALQQGVELFIKKKSYEE